MNIYVGNLPYSTDEGELRELFSAHGEVTRVSLITDKYTNESKGFGFVEMANQAEAENAIKAIDGTQLSGRSIKVNQAKPRNDAKGGGGRNPRFR